jgi:DNA-binding transcriptional LysR family regulator
MSPEDTMELSDLRYFLNVATVKSFSKGAVMSHVSPPAISKTIHKLEAELGAKLFTRTTRRVLLTEAGERLRKRCLKIFDELDGARRDLEEVHTTVSGVLRIGAMEVFSIRLLPLALSRLLRAHPLVSSESHEMVPQEMERLIIEGRLDVGFTIGAGHVRGVRYQSVGRSPGVLVCGRSHPLYRRGRIRAADLSRHPFVAPRFLGMEHLPVLDQFPEHKHPRKIDATIELLQMGVELVREGNYLGFFPEVCVREHLDRKRLRALRGARFGVSFDLQALTRADATPKRSVVRLIEELTAIIESRS